MSDYIDETPLTDDEIEAAIAAAKKAKAERVKAQKKAAEAAAEKAHEEKPEPKREEDESRDGDSSESLFNQIDSNCDSEPLSPKMESAKSFSDAFAAAKSKREEDLQQGRKKKKKNRKKEAPPEPEQEEESEELEELEPEQPEAVIASRELEVDSAEPAVFEDYDENGEYDAEEAVVEFEPDGEEEEYTSEEEEDAQPGEVNGIFEPDDEETPVFGTAADIDGEDEEYYEDEDEEDGDEEDSAVSKKTKIIIGVIIAVLVLAIAAVGAFFLLGGDSDGEPTTSTVDDGNSVKSISFADSSITVKVGQSIPLDLIIEPESATDKVLKLKSNDTSIATVDGAGNVTGVASGSTTVTATLKSNETITASVIVNVIDEKQDAINNYNKLISSILDGSTDIDSDSDTDTESDEEEESSESDTDTEENTAQPKDVLTGSIIRDLDSDGELELALYYTTADDSFNVRIFNYTADTDSDEEAAEEEPQYDEYGNLIESTDSDTDSEESEDSDSSADVKKVIKELDIYSEKYSECYASLEDDPTSWDTVYMEIKESETSKVRVTILSEDYKAPTYVYESSDEKIATVDNQGNVKALEPGVCYITVTSPLNSEASATVKIKVKDDTDLLEDYLAQIPIVNQTNDAVIPTETLVAKKIEDIDNDGLSELLLKFSYGNNVETINMVKIENEQCVVYKTYNNISDLYDYYEGDGSYTNSILIHYTTGKVCMEYKAVVAKTDSKTKTSEQKILSVEDNGSLSELVNFSTTTDISTKTVTSEVVIDDEPSDSDAVSSEDYNSEWYGDSSVYEDDSDIDTGYSDSDSGYYDDPYYYDDGIYANFVTLTLDSDGDIGVGIGDRVKTLPEAAGEPDGDEDENNGDDYDNTASSGEDDDNSTSSRMTSTVTSEVTEETTKYFVNGTPVEESVYEETLSTYSSRYSVWSNWESV